MSGRRRWAHFTIVSAVCLGAALTTAAWAGSASIASIRGDLSAQGAAYVLNHDFRCEGGEGYRIIERGDPQAARLAVDLLKVSSSACASERIVQSLARAMVRNASAVLPYVGSTEQLSPARLCLPQEIEVPITHRDIAERRRALGRVRSHKLEGPRQACIAVLDAAEARL